MHDLPLITTIAAGFSTAWVLGLLTQWLRLSPIVGYLLAGVIIGPYSPGFVGDLDLAHQLAEVGVILLMFGVGLHFHLKDLLAVKSVAIPGAIGQSLIATIVAVLVFSAFGMSPQTGAVIGIAMAVASTVVLMRVLMDADMLNSPQGHIAVGWLLVEDVLTVVVLVLIPVLGTGDMHGAAATGLAANPIVAILIALLKLAAVVAIIMVAGARVVPWALTQVARLRSRELFTLTVMVFSIAIAAGAYALFGASMALGAFLAGMVVAQSPVSHQAAADALPLRDAFAVLFFVSVGMLFDPMFLIREPLMMLAAMGIILIVKPLAALLIVATLGHSVRTALTVALGLAQIGEFSFIVSDLARRNGLMPDAGHNMLVGGAILSITLNPILFRSLYDIERWLKKFPRLYNFLNAKAERRGRQSNIAMGEAIAEKNAAGQRLAVVVGFGPVGRNVDRLLREAGLETLIIDMNMDTVAELKRQGRTAIFGDASRDAILELAGVGEASHLVLTLPQSSSLPAVVSMARSMNSKLKIFARARYLRDQGELEQVGVTAAIFEEAEAAVALARAVLVDAGAGGELIERTVRDIRMRLMLENVSGLRSQAVRTIMIPWRKVKRLVNTLSLDQVRRLVGEQHFSRWPVVDAATGEPVGYLLAKDLIGLNSGTSDWTGLIRPLESVSSDNDIESTLQYFQREGATICLVRNQAAPVGIVTLEDILEQVVGRIEDEYPRHRKLSLQEFLLTDDELLDLQCEDVPATIAAMVKKIPAGQRPADVDLIELALQREREQSTSIGGGIAIPHIYCSEIPQPMEVFGRSQHGIPFGHPLGELVHLIFLLIMPVELSEVHVILLSEIGRATSNEAIRHRLLHAASPDEIRDLLILANADDPVPQ